MVVANGTRCRKAALDIPGRGLRLRDGCMGSRALADTDEHIGETIAGRVRVTAAPLWMRAVVAPAALRFQAACPGVGLILRTVTFVEGVRRLSDGATDLHCGGIDDERPLPGFLRREPLLQVTAGIVTRRDHPIQAARPTPADLVRHPWLDCYNSARADADRRGPSLAEVLERLRARTGARPRT